MNTVECPLGPRCDTSSKRHRAGSKVLEEHTAQARESAIEKTLDTGAPTPLSVSGDEGSPATEREFSPQAAEEVLRLVNDPNFNDELSDALKDYNRWGGIAGAARKRYRANLNRSGEVSDDEFREAFLDYSDKSIERSVVYSRVVEEEEHQLEEIEDAIGEFSPVEKRNGSRLGFARRIGSAEIGSEERSALLKEGISGYDAIKAMGLTPWVDYKTGRATMSEPHFIELNQSFVVAHKNEAPEKNATDFDARRRSAWRDVMLAAHLTELPEGSTVRMDTGVFKREGSEFGLAAPDGVTTGPDGNGLIYTYVSDNSYDWRRGVPFAERARALYELDVTGADFADVLARVEGQYQWYRIGRGDTLDGHPEGIRVSDCMRNVQQTWDKVKEGPVSNRRKIADTDYDRDLAINNMYGLFGGSKEEIKSELMDRVSRGEDTDTAVRSMIGDRWSRSAMGSIASIDGETASAEKLYKNERGEMYAPAFAPELDNWIDTGIVVHDSSGKKVDELNVLHGLDPRIESLNGTGAEDVHRISPEMVRGKKPFKDDYHETKRKLDSSDVILVHNDKFESPRLGGYIPSTRKSRPEGDKRWFDSAWLTRHFMEQPAEQREFYDGSLNSLVVDTGGSYDGAHRAHRDAEMTIEAVEKVFAKDGWWRTIPGE